MGTQADIFHFIFIKLPAGREELGGWESVEMVRRYAHLSSEHLAGYVDRLSAFRVVVEESDSYDLATVNKKGLSENHLSL